jgi:hypothetical protein
LEREHRDQQKETDAQPNDAHHLPSPIVRSCRRRSNVSIFGHRRPRYEDYFILHGQTPAAQLFRDELHSGSGTLERWASHVSRSIRSRI